MKKNFFKFLVLGYIVFTVVFFSGCIESPTDNKDKTSNNISENINKTETKEARTPTENKGAETIIGNGRVETTGTRNVTLTNATGTGNMTLTNMTETRNVTLTNVTRNEGTGTATGHGRVWTTGGGGAGAVGTETTGIKEAEIGTRNVTLTNATGTGNMTLTNMTGTRNVTLTNATGTGNMTLTNTTETNITHNGIKIPLPPMPPGWGE